MTKTSERDFTEVHEKMINENDTRSKGNEKEIGVLKITDATLSEKVTSMCKNIGGLTKVLWFLATTLFLALVGIVTDYLIGR